MSWLDTIRRDEFRRPYLLLYGIGMMMTSGFGVIYFPSLWLKIFSAALVVGGAGIAILSRQIGKSPPKK